MALLKNHGSGSGRIFAWSAVGRDDKISSAVHSPGTVSKFCLECHLGGALNKKHSVYEVARRRFAQLTESEPPQSAAAARPWAGRTIARRARVGCYLLPSTRSFGKTGFSFRVPRDLTYENVVAMSKPHLR